MHDDTMDKSFEAKFQRARALRKRRDECVSRV